MILNGKGCAVNHPYDAGTSEVIGSCSSQVSFFKEATASTLGYRLLAGHILSILKAYLKRSHHKSMMKIALSMYFNYVLFQAAVTK